MAPANTAPSESGPRESGATRILRAAMSDRQKAATAIVPAERVGLMAVPLPLRSERQKRSALPFAVEDSLATPLEQTHVALARDLPDQHVLAMAAACTDMDAWVAAHPGKGLLPELFVLPAPDEAGAWNTLRDGERVLVRASDGTGFVIGADMLPHLWAVSGRPRVMNRGAALPDTMIWSAAAPVPPDPAELKIDLRQGRYRPRRKLGRPVAALAAGVAVVGLLHLALAYADLRAMRGLEAEHRAATTALLAAKVPQATIYDDPQVLYRQLSRTSARPGGALLPRLDRATGALMAAGVPVNVQRLVWSADAGTLTLQVEAGGLDQLQAAEEALRGAGLEVDSGTATAGNGAARAELTLTGGPGR